MSTIPDDWFCSFPFNHLKEYSNSKGGNPYDNPSMLSPSSYILAPVNNNPPHVPPLVPSNSPPSVVNDSWPHMTTWNHPEQVTPYTAWRTPEYHHTVNGHVDISLLPTFDKVAAGISKRLDFIGCDNISNDLYLTTATKLLTIEVIHHIEIGRAKMFMICNECSGHRVCQK